MDPCLTMYIQKIRKEAYSIESFEELTNRVKVRVQPLVDDWCWDMTTDDICSMDCKAGLLDNLKNSGSWILYGIEDGLRYGFGSIERVSVCIHPPVHLCSSTTHFSLGDFWLSSRYKES
ncbi:uncharacterized protein LOC111876780 isoform X2 [Lactuca sativa]|uniref:uncharacterized protein LOC111876780 isoform X2 n=1 Tax=Lactuca sativa TaxID=4236 RepID=UPI000CD96E36|nr:uncharacterized protein LOC111876780 isoform X2 [Lactuca sativa]